MLRSGRQVGQRIQAPTGPFSRWNRFRPPRAAWGRRLRRHMGKERQRVARTQSTVQALDRNEKDELIELYRQMVLIRRFEERAGEMYTRGKIAGFLHLAIGQESANVGAVAGLKPDDDIFTHYRDHGHAIARGLDPNALMAELFGRETGVAGGRGGSMHFADASKHFWGGYAIVGAHLPLAVGMAFARQRQGDGRVVMVIFGDGSTNTGPFHEAMNLAAVWKLPVIFFCENNMYGMGTAIHRASAETEMYKRGAAYNIESRQVDGSDVLAVRDTVREAAALCREGKGPVFVEAVTYRFRGHSTADPELYRDREEVQQWRARDPIPRFRQRLIDEGIADDAELKAVEQEVEDVVDESIRFADESPEPALETIFDDVYVDF